MAPALGDTASALLRAPWLAVQACFAKQLIFTVGGHLPLSLTDRTRCVRVARASDPMRFDLLTEMTYPRYQEHKVPICGGHLYVSNDCEHVRWTGAIGDDGMPVNHRSSRGTGPATIVH